MGTRRARATALTLLRDYLESDLGRHVSERAAARLMAVLQPDQLGALVSTLDDVHEARLAIERMDAIAAAGEPRPITAIRSTDVGRLRRRATS